ncbi:MAG: ABC transporter substrate-binding protein [Christensenella sp.]|uniref:ABC transporter substrate-binding protein n=1 Tax=Christensenella sp. TaxID=1935934 RepID=UPI002B1EA262|nr:ABC transporter substrate-binding protein [Christensenella sp.]MEA5002770.1 ABC transporter substrate-binding protein [Christensenella sp.]
MNWGKRILAAGVAAATVLLCACTNLSSTTPSASSSTGATASATDTKAPVAQEGGELFIAMPQGVTDLDPLAATDEDLINLLTLIYDTPVRLGVGSEPQPGLAESWEVDETGTVYTFHFRQNLMFADGVTPFNVDDVIYSLKRVLEAGGTTDPAAPQPEGSTPPEGSAEPEPSASPEASSSASPSAGTTEGGGEVELPESNRYVQYNSLLSNYERLDDYTLKLTMTKPGREALYLMTFPVVSATLYESSGTPVGTGAYRVDGYEQDVRMTLVRNDGWWGEKPYIEKIAANAVSGADQKIEKVESSILDFITTDVLYAGQYKHAGKTQVVDYMTNYYDCLVPNLGSDILGDSNVRQAISYAIDRREIISTVLLNHAVPANMPIAPDFYAYDSKYKQDDDLATARDYLRASGYKTDEEAEGNALAITLIVPSERDASYRVEAAKAIKKQLARVGVDITIEELAPADFYARLTARDYQLAFVSYYLDENPELSFMFDSGGSGNYNGVSNQELTDAIAACSSAFGEEQVKAAYSELQRQLMERVPQIGLYFRMNSIICDQAITGITGARQNRVFEDVNKWFVDANH